MSPKLSITPITFSEPELRAWKNGKYSLVKDCPRPLKRILRKKAGKRPGRRFFGEAHVAATERYRKGWYGSFKWHTSPRWCGSQELQDPYQVKFRNALLRHFPDLKEFQQIAAASMRKLGGRKPVGPDLWLITPGKHRFIEVKLPGDSVGRHQLIGLALIAMFLRSDRPISVEIVNLHSGERPAGSEELVRQFGAICSRLKRPL